MVFFPLVSPPKPCTIYYIYNTHSKSNNCWFRIVYKATVHYKCSKFALPESMHALDTPVHGLSQHFKRLGAVVNGVRDIAVPWWNVSSYWIWSNVTIKKSKGLRVAVPGNCTSKNKCLGKYIDKILFYVERTPEACLNILDILCMAQRENDSESGWG